MWLITTVFAAIIFTALWYFYPRYYLGIPALMFWGAGVMIFVDHLIGFLSDGGYFFSLKPEDILLSFYILIPILVIWEVTLIIKDPNGRLKKGGG